MSTELTGAIKVLEPLRYNVPVHRAAGDDLAPCTLQVAGGKCIHFFASKSDLCRGPLLRMTSSVISLSLDGKSYEASVYQTNFGVQKHSEHALRGVEFLAPSESPAHAYVMVSFAGVKKIKFGVFQPYFKRFKILIDTMDKMPGRVIIEVNKILTKERRRIFLSDVKKACVGFSIVGKDSDLLCQLRLSSAERRDLHQRWLKRRKGL